MKYMLILSVLVLSTVSCNHKRSDKLSLNEVEFRLENPQTVSLLGDQLNSSKPSLSLTNKWIKKMAMFDADTTNIENIIWYGRFTAYMGNYNKAIDIYTDGLMLHSDDPRLYRHRGHRYITLRKFDKAIDDFLIAAKLIKGKENIIEPDGMPNDQNIPVSTLHSNIYYHLGLAYYLKNDLPNALTTFRSCLQTSTNPDNVVSATHWIYMILRRLERPEEAMRALEVITPTMQIIENHSYYNLCLFYKGLLSEGDFIDAGDNQSANDASKYGIANWYIYNGNKKVGYQKLKNILSGPTWASFGHIAAEADFTRQ